MSAGSARLPSWLVACEARNADGWVCTRNKGHGAAHQAFLDDRIVATWGAAASPFACPSATGPGPCLNPTPHDAPRGCVHHSTSGVPDRHERGDDE